MAGVPRFLRRFWSRRWARVFWGVVLVATLLAVCACAAENPASNDSSSGVGGASTGGSAAAAGSGGASATASSGGSGFGGSGGGNGGQAATGSGGSAAGTGGNGTGGDGMGGVGAGGASMGGASMGGASMGGASMGGGGTGATGGSAGIGGDGGSGGTMAYEPCPPSGTPCRIMPFGDSITDGFNVPGGYRQELFRLAHQAGQSITFVGSQTNGPDMVDGVDFPRDHEGHSGYTIEDEPQASRSGIAQYVMPSMTAYQPHIVLLMIGTNDVDVQIDLADAPNRLQVLIDAIFAQDEDVLLVVAQLTPTGTDAENVRVEAYNAQIPDLVSSRAAEGRHILLVDMYEAFTSDSEYKTALLADNLHPNESGYDRMGQVWYEAIGSTLR